MRERSGIRACKYLCALIVVIIIIFPIYWMVISSFKTPSEIITYPPRILPKEFTFQNYVDSFTEYGLMTYLLNSVIVTISTVVLSVIIASLTAFALNFLKFKLKKLLTNLLYLVQVLPAVVMLVPLFIIYKEIGLLNTHASLVLTYLGNVIGVPIGIILLTGYTAEIPKELFEAAEIDGASTFQLFRKVLLPLATPGMICTAIYIFIVTWQEYMFALNLITKKNLYTMPVGLTMYAQQWTTNWGGMMAASTIIAIPAIVLFVMVQNYFIDNLAGSVKG